MRRSWYRITAAAERAELYLYGVIGRSFFDEDAVTAKQFIDDLKALPASVGTIELHLNSPGGDVFDGLAIANALKQHQARVEVSIEALAASAASIVAMAGDVIRIADNAMVMIHNPSAIVAGDADDMREMARALEAITDALIATYRWHSELSESELKALMDATTWMSAEEAVAKGFATEIVDDVEIEASFPPESLRYLGAIPEPHRARIAALVARPPALPTPPAPTEPDATAAAVTDVLAACERAGMAFLARPLIAAKATAAQLEARLAEAKEIRGACSIARIPELAETLIRDGVSLATAKAVLLTFTAKLDNVEIDASLDPTAAMTSLQPRAKLDTAAIYTRWNTPVAGASR